MSAVKKINRLVKEGKVEVSKNLLYQDFWTTDGKTKVVFEKTEVLPYVSIRRWVITHNGEKELLYTYKEATDRFLELISEE